LFSSSTFICVLFVVSLPDSNVLAEGIVWTQMFVQVDDCDQT